MRGALLRAAWWAGAPIRAVLIGLIRLYRVTVGQLLGGQCRFYPSCSSYAEGAIRRLGWIRGSALSVWRVARCNPFSAGGVDYPPRGAARSAQTYDGVNNSVGDNVIHGPRESRDVTAPDAVEGLRRGALASAEGRS